MNEVVRTKSSYTNKVPVYLLVLYLAFEYGRIHTLLGPVGALHLPLFTTIGILLFLLTEGPTFNRMETRCFLGLIILMAVHVPFATNRYWAFETTRMVFTYLIIYVAMTKYVVSYEMFKKMMFLWLICGIFLCVRGVRYGGLIKGSAFFSDPNDFALAMNMFLGISYFRFLENPRKNILMLAMIGLFIIGILASSSRGGFIGLCVMLTLMWIKSRKRILVVLLAPAMVLLVLVMASPQYWDRMRTITEEEENIGEDTAGSGRVYLWKRAWEMFLDHPLFGVGPDNYPWRVSEYEPEGKLKGRGRGGSVVHSIYFTMISELGLVGCFIFGGILLLNYKTLRGIIKQFGGIKKIDSLSGIRERNGNELSKPMDLEVLKTKRMMYFDTLGLYVALAGFLASGAFLSVLYYPHFWILSAMIASMGRLKEELENKELALNKGAVDIPKSQFLGLAE